jgi:hypothetical protein
MSHDENFSDQSSFLHIIIAIIVMLAFPLLPMLTGWYDLLSQ